MTTEGGAGGAGGLQGGTRSKTSLSVAGQRLEYNRYTLDGVENTDPNFNSYIIHPSVDALQEFKVQTGVYSAEFGRGASQINVTTKSGTNQYHGDRIRVSPQFGAGRARVAAVAGHKESVPEESVTASR